MAQAMNPVAVLGAGSWGTAIALHLARAGHAVRLWEFDPRRARELEKTRLSLPFLPDHPLPSAVAVMSDLRVVLADAPIAVTVVPSHVLRSVGTQIGECLPGLSGARPQIWVSAIKGIEEGSGAMPSEILAETARVAPEDIVVLAGPSFALEVAEARPTAILAAGSDAARTARIQALFSTDTLRVYTSDDVRGVEIGVALKNVVAIAAGLAAGLDLGHNALGALLTRGLAEIARLGGCLGGRFETFLGLAGIGDLVITCTSPLSRNYRVGFALARGRRLEEILTEMGMVAEGVRTTRSALELAERLQVEMPITAQVHAVLYEGKAPRSAVAELMRRPPKPEIWGGER